MLKSFYRVSLSWPNWFLLIAWLAGNGLLFGFTFVKYIWDKEYTYLFSMLGYSIAVSRGAAAALNLNCALVLLPVCRNIIDFIRSCLCVRQSKHYLHNVIVRQLDNHIFFHKLIAYAICFWTVIHVSGHAFNIERFINAISGKHNAVNYWLSTLPHDENATWINPIPRNNTNPMYEMIVMIPGWSGLTASIILILIVSASSESVRQKMHEIFVYTHYLFILFFVFIIVHGFGRVVKRQSNHWEHNPYLCHETPHQWGHTEHCPTPTFDSEPPDTWMWVIGPLALYAIEVCIKIFNRFRKVNIIEVIFHPMNVIEIRMTKEGFKSRAGQYVKIMCTQISYNQWHPFTLTSAPSDSYFSVHIQAVGDWTKKLLKLFTESKDEPGKFPKLAVDGPYGNSCEDVYTYEVLLLVGAGIGVTPFASILKDIWYLHANKKMSRLKKVHFVWLCRDQAFRWFNGMLKQMELTLQDAKKSDLLDLQIFWTSGWDVSMQKQLIETVSDATDFITDLRSKTQFGRPDWKKIFNCISSQHSTEKVGVFYCGPKELSKVLKKFCAKHSKMSHMTPQFVFHKEKF